MSRASTRASTRSSARSPATAARGWKRRSCSGPWPVGPAAAPPPTRRPRRRTIGSTRSRRHRSTRSWSSSTTDRTPRASARSRSRRRCWPTARRSSTSPPRSSTGRSSRARPCRRGRTTAPCPGPTIKVQPGDHVRIVLDNQLPQSTAIHFHGIDVPNAMDGVPDVTQEPVKPGEQFTYEFVAQGPGGRDVPLAPPRASTRCPTACSVRSSSATSRVPAGRRGVAGGPDGAQRRRRDRAVAQRQVVPGDRAGRSRSRATGSRSTT